MASWHCPRLKKPKFLFFYPKFQNPSASILLLWNSKKRSPLFRALQGKNCAVCKKQVALMKELVKKKKPTEYFRNQNQVLLNSFSNAHWRLIFAKYLRPTGQWHTGLLSHCHPICSSHSTISENHISKPNISWIARELHIFLSKYSLKSYQSQSNFYLSSFKETSRRVIVSHNTGTQLIHHPSCFNQALWKEEVIYSNG